MAKRKGNDEKIYIESSTPGTYNVIAGQTGHSVNRAAQQIDTTTKDDGAYGTSIPGSRALSISMTVIPDLPDANGLERLHARANVVPQDPTNFEIRRAPYATPGDVILRGSFYIGDMGDSATVNQVKERTITLLAAAAPSIDTAG